MMKSGEEWDEKVEEKRERQWRGWLGFGIEERLKKDEGELGYRERIESIRVRK